MHLTFGKHKIKDEEVRIVRMFLHTSFHVVSRRENPVYDHENNFSSSDSNREIGQDRLYIAQKFKNRDVRRCILDLGRCFLSGSIAGFVLRKKLAEGAEARLSNELSLCSNYLNRATSLCEVCVNSLHPFAREIENDLHSAAHLVTSICDASKMNSESNLNALCEAVWLILKMSCNICRQYLSCVYHSNSSAEVERYKFLTSIGTSLARLRRS